MAPSRWLPVHRRISCTHRLARLTDSTQTRLTDWALRTYQTFRRQKKEMARVLYSASLMQAEFPTETRHRHGHRKREAMRAASILRITQHMSIAINLNYRWFNSFRLWHGMFVPWTLREYYGNIELTTDLASSCHADFVPIELDLRRTAYEHSSRFRRYHTPDGCGHTLRR